jgi:hypothetical protein
LFCNRIRYKKNILAFLLVLVLSLDIGFVPQCRTNCSIGLFSFNKSFDIPDGKREEYISSSSCSAQLNFDYSNQLLFADFHSNSISSDLISISGPSLALNIKRIKQQFASLIVHQMVEFNVLMIQKI